MKTTKTTILSAALFGLIIFAACSSGSSSKEKELTTKFSSAFQAADITEQLKYNRAMEAIIWGLPMVNFDMMHQAAVRDAKADWNQLVFWSKPFDWKNQTLTPNTDALYIMPFFNTKDVGPMVLEIPAADANGHLVGTIMDAWQMALEDIGPAGVDKGKGGKYLFLPPNYKEKIPPGHIVLQSQTYTGYALLRSIPKTGSDTDIAIAVDYLKKIKFYPLSQADKSPETKFVDAHGILVDATIPYDIRFFESLDRMLQYEPWLERDKVMINALKSIGIEKGKAFKPNEKMQSLLKASLIDGREWLTNYYETAFEPFFPTSRWFLPAIPELVKDIGEGFTDPNSYPVDGRGDLFYFAFTTVKHLGAGQFYLFVSRDKEGKPMDGSKNYKLHVPANVPVQQYWSLTIYDFETHALIRDVAYGSRSSLTPALQINADGSVDLYIGPKAPQSKESNWLPTKETGRFEGLFRLYGPTKSLFEKEAWILPDFEEVK